MLLPHPASQPTDPIIVDDPSDLHPPRNPNLLYLDDMEEERLIEIIGRVNASDGKSKLDVPRPEPFEGVGEDVIPFIRRLQGYFIAIGSKMTEAQQRINFAISLMSKAGGKTWRDNYYMNIDSESEVPCYETFQDFVDALKTSFPVYNEKGQYITSFLDFKQGTQSTTSYVNKFQSLALMAGLKDATPATTSNPRMENNYELISERFKAGLKSSLLTLCLNQATLPVTMTGWYDLALRLDSQQKGHHVSASRRERDPDAMDIDAITLSHKAQWSNGCVLNAADKQEHWDKKLCFYCHNPGHSTIDCRTKKREKGQKGETRRDGPSQHPRNRDERRALVRAMIMECGDNKKMELYQDIQEMDFA